MWNTKDLKTIYKDQTFEGGKIYYLINHNIFTPTPPQNKNRNTFHIKKFKISKYVKQRDKWVRNWLGDRLQSDNESFPNSMPEQPRDQPGNRELDGSVCHLECSTVTLSLPNVQQEQSQQLSCVSGPKRGRSHNCCCWRWQWKPHCISNWQEGTGDKEKQPTRSLIRRNGRWAGSANQVKRGALACLIESWKTNTGVSKETHLDTLADMLLRHRRAQMLLPLCLQTGHGAIVLQADRHGANTYLWAEQELLVCLSHRIPTKQMNAPQWHRMVACKGF